ncbi:FAD-binding oxidoreductase [Dactylosporangium aurantiacum]|uniref:FAD-binding oxidoreductase n=1 Tax=Dactylosporangium aurantiacum TaxID=35754 RepID=A0A9Q9IDY5_9ACTN|nr:FAD-binding oxidoreductase [Dactylosporangium aurantiacum]MDG6107479.1 FAD-binding oxidoreductase [Dactylosporangium aurantiacum]UWZ54272.1 FAD-binding oxidoreductase [Dactylosporangium aurantiacum]
MTQVKAAGWAALAGAVEEVALPPSARYETLRRPADPRFDHVRPLAVVRCATPDGVAAAIRFARDAGLPAVLRGGGHDFAGRSTTTGIVIDLAPMDTVTVTGGTARVGAGARLGHVYDALAAHGRTVPAGCGPDVGIAGLTLGGGLGVLGRRHGLTCDQLLAAEVVLADGRVVTCDEHTHPDLFWALRGGTGRFGAVTAFTFATVPAPALHSFRLTWPGRSAPALLEAWQAWAPAAPDDVAASLHLVVPADPARPPHATVVGTLALRPGLLDDLVAAVGRPLSDERRRATHRETKRILAAADEGLRGAYTWMRSGFVGRALPGDAVAALTRHLFDGRRPGQRRMLDLMPMGGAYNRVPAQATAFVHRAELFLLQHIVAADPGDSSAALDWLAGSDRLAAPWRSGGVYQNFPDPDLPDAAAAYFGANLPRLRRVKAQYDPDGIFGLYA